MRLKLQSRLVPVEEVERALVAVLRGRGVPSPDARAVAAHLVEGSLRGYERHGVDRILEIVDGLERGTLRAEPQLQVVRQGGAFVVVDAGGGLGVPAARDAVARAVELARGAGLGLAAVVNAGHLGILSPWAEAIAEAGQLGLVVSTTSPAVVFPGGSRVLLGTNPLACAFPAEDGIASTDMATSTISRGDVLHAQQTGVDLPGGTAVDGAGQPTVDAGAALQGGLLPLGGNRKGGLLSLILATLAGPAVGGIANHRVTGTRWMNEPPCKADVFLALDLPQLTDPAAFREEVTSLFAELTDDVPGFHVPGRGAAQRRVEALARGIPVSRELASWLSGEVDRRVAR